MIALVGLYTVLTVTVATPRREIAVRVAIGASRGQIGAAVVREGATLIGAGLVAGVGLATLSARAISAQFVWRDSTGRSHVRDGRGDLCDRVAGGD